jgi:hypothetical protein
MQTLVAYATRGNPDAEHVRAGIERVESHYRLRWRQAQHRGVDLGGAGLHLWDKRESGCRWPSWVSDADMTVATLHAPLGYERVVGVLPPEVAAAPLARALLRSASTTLALTPPWVVAALADRSLHLFTDGLGLGRLFQLRTDDGYVWTNRPAAAFRFSGAPAYASKRGWQYFAACGWFMAESTPYEGMTLVDAATHITWQFDRRDLVVSRLDSFGRWADLRADSGSLRVDSSETARALTAVAASVGQVWDQQPSVNLSGGRDSRLVAAAFIRAGATLRLTTNDAVPGEADVARRLVAALDHLVEHVVIRPSGNSAGLHIPVDVLRRGLEWHRYAEGLRPASYLPSSAPQTLAATDLVIGGAGGELGHGHFYPSNVLAIADRPVDARVSAFKESLAARIISAAGPSRQARGLVRAQIDRVLDAAVSVGIDDGTALDCFYARERLRKWGTTGERLGVISPLLVPEFVTAALRLTPAQRRTATLHRAVLAELVPAWAEVPFFAPAPSRRPAARLMRLADAADRDVVQSIIADEAWSQEYDARSVRRLWARSRSGASTAPDEALLQRLVWRSAFDDYLAELNGEPELCRSPVRVLPTRMPGLTDWSMPHIRQETARRLWNSRAGHAARRLPFVAQAARSLRRHARGE